MKLEDIQKVQKVKYVKIFVWNGYGLQSMSYEYDTTIHMML